MAMEPITLFARIANPARVARLLRELVPAVEIEGPDDAWLNASITFANGWKRRTFTFTHDPAYYSEPSCSVQMNGMRGYFPTFANTDRKVRGMVVTTRLKFCLGTLFEQDLDPNGDVGLAAADRILIINITIHGSELLLKAPRALPRVGSREASASTALVATVTAAGVHDWRRTSSIG